MGIPTDKILVDRASIVRAVFGVICLLGIKEEMKALILRQEK
jgi:hypothetical protein